MSRKQDLALAHTSVEMLRFGYNIRKALYERYCGLATTRFRWFDNSGKSDDMFSLSANKAPEKYLFHNARVAIFEYGGQTHMLPMIPSGEVNLYGEPSSWRVQPAALGSKLADEISALKLDRDNSVILYNTPYPINEPGYIWDMCKPLAETIVTIHSRMLYARTPYLMTVEDYSDADAQNFVNQIFNFEPVIIRSGKSSLFKPDIFNLGIALDTGLFDAASYWEAAILWYLGYQALDSHKRAQMSVTEVLSSQEKIDAHILHMKWSRDFAIEAYNKKKKTLLNYECLLDIVKQNAMGNRADDGIFGETGESGMYQSVQNQYPKKF